MTTARKLLALCSLAALLGATALPAAAQGWYAGISAGSTSVDVCDDLVAVGATSCDDTNTGFKLYAGNEVSRNLGVELGWVDLGKVTASGPGGSAKVEVDGFQIAALGILPVNPRFNVFGKLGLYVWDVSLTGSGGSLSDDGSDIMFGVGLNWNLTQNLDLRAEWEQFDIDGDDVSLISAGVRLRF